MQRTRDALAVRTSILDIALATTTAHWNLDLARLLEVVAFMIRQLPVSYNFRRGILCDGEFPHLSSRVRSLVPGASASDLPLKRVVVGLNLFPTEIDASVAKFSEHSGAFNRYVNLSHAAVKQTPRLYSPRHGGGWTLASVRSNPKQAAFLKLLVRKVREQKEKTATAET
ncbi:hypothetical protein PsorP6_012256 [Peronosclerospora sorghi]|uniref:Uncharacterized protein n=1 Tax=Peronosclerospora sorghi TaxID=230839 RepID=A0ACC0WIA8_9STRA|nr:hypothetical protein PsorP6_012256 [Peronosclerospora sorghi]